MTVISVKMASWGDSVALVWSERSFQQKCSQPPLQHLLYDWIGKHGLVHVARVWLCAVWVWAGFLFSNTLALPGLVLSPPAFLQDIDMWACLLGQVSSGSVWGSVTQSPEGRGDLGAAGVNSLQCSRVPKESGSAPDTGHRAMAKDAPLISHLT